MLWLSGPVPVAIDAAQTGVTDGKAATQSSTCSPRSISSSSAGARPPATARPSTAGLPPPTRAWRASSRRRPRGRASSPQDAQARVLLALAPATPGEQEGERADDED